ncbi:uncharacterized protein LOC144145384 [Haemaphysalis longicornis]
MTYPEVVLLLGAALKLVAGDEPLFEKYAVTPYHLNGDVYCSASALNGGDNPPWAEYFGGGCEGRQCKRSGTGDLLVLHFRCRPGGGSQSRQCSSPQDRESFPKCCLPPCTDAIY